MGGRPWGACAFYRLPRIFTVFKNVTDGMGRSVYPGENAWRSKLANYGEAGAETLNKIRCIQATQSGHFEADMGLKRARDAGYVWVLGTPPFLRKC